jgi:hypothetical protein
MSNINYFIKNKLDIYDKTNDDYNHLIDMKEEYIEYCKYDKNEEITEHLHYAIFKNNKKKEIYKGNITKLGIFFEDSKIWIWAWAIPTSKPNDTYACRNILLYGLELDIHVIGGDNPTLPTYYIDLYQKPMFITSRLYITNKIMLDILLALSLGITKAKFVRPIKTNSSIVYYLVY